MKKLLCLIATVLLLVSCTGCGGKEDANSTVSQTVSARVTERTLIGSGEEYTGTVDIDITEAMYVTYINEIYNNHASYEGKVIRIEGMFTVETVEQTGMSYYYVFRRGPGCCGSDGSMCGFEFTFDTYPEENDWIEVVGTLRSYKEGNATYLTLDGISVAVLPERGSEIVNA